MKSRVFYSLSLVILLLSGCSKDKIPGVYRIDIQQGNEVSQEMLSQLEAGMAKNQVVFVMGTPLLIDTFHPNRWDYIYSFQPGNGDREQRRITLFFDEDERLSHIDGDIRTVEHIDLADRERIETNVVVPLTDRKVGFFNRVLGVFGLGPDEAEIMKEDQAEAAEKLGREPERPSDTQLIDSPTSAPQGDVGAKP